MGQRLNLEIWNDGKVLANAYYHWSAYTPSSAELVSKALEYIQNNPDFSSNDLLYAIRVLEATGAGLTTLEKNYADTASRLGGNNFAECNGRNYGLIAISEDGISDTRFWAEGTVLIYLDERRLSFGVFFKQDAWDWEKEQKEEYENKDANWRNLECVNFNFDDIKFHSWETCKDFLTKQQEDFRTEIDKFTVITPIY